jgi:threonine/homoserine/homoserine lactone efflux protein
MGTVIGDLLPLAIGVAISPVPIIAVILMLLSQRPGPTSVGFLLGWIAGIVVVTTVVLLLVGHASNTDSGPSTVSSVIKLVLGALLVLIAVRQWRHRPREGDTATMPKWMSAIDSFSSVKAAGLGALLSGINPKNLIMCLGAGTTIGAGHLSAGGNVVAVAIFTVLASCTIAVPVIVYLSARERMAAPLTSLRTWLTANNAAVMAVLVLVIGVALIGKGIGGLSS